MSQRQVPPGMLSLSLGSRQKCTEKDLGISYRAEEAPPGHGQGRDRLLTVPSLALAASIALSCSHFPWAAGNGMRSRICAAVVQRKPKVLPVCHLLVLHIVPTT